MSKSIFTIPIGSLTSISALHHNVAARLIEFSDCYRSGVRPKVVFDMMAIQPKKMNMAALTALLSISLRLRQFIDEPIQIIIPWNPAIFGFWNDIGFFRIALQNDLFAWPDGMIGGFSMGETNPHTKILHFKHTNKFSSFSSGKEINNLKDNIRSEVKESILRQCGPLFHATTNASELSPKLKDQVAVTSAELVLNAQLWGQSDAFVGLQRSSAGVSVAVCDSGIGFYKSLYNKNSSKVIEKPKNHLEAVVLGSIVNNQDFGLRRAIEMVSNYGGWVVTSSYSAELVWKLPLWNKILAQVEDKHNIEQNGYLQSIMRPLTPIFGPATPENKMNGYCRNWGAPLRGSRISFELPFTKN